MLQRRPDIAAAERRVAEANALIGVAKSAFFPSLTLSATGGWNGPSFGDLFTVPNRIWSIGPAIALTIFDAGLRSAQTDEAIAAYDETVAAYRQQVLTAFQEVEDYLAAQAMLGDESDMQSAAVAAAIRSETITRNQYRAGAVSYTHLQVKTGPTSGENTIIEEGLKPGQIVVTDGVDKLRDGSKIRVIRPKTANTNPPAAPAPSEAAGKDGKTPESAAPDKTPAPQDASAAGKAASSPSGTAGNDGRQDGKASGNAAPAPSGDSTKK